MKCSLGRITVSALLIAAPLSGASAADMPLKAPPPPPAPVYSWTGFYAGVNAGYGWGSSDAHPAGTNTSPCIPFPFGFCGTPIQPIIVSGGVASALAIPPVLSPNARGGLLGGTIGYNQQFGRWVAGLEADLAWTRIVGSDTRGGGAGWVAPLSFNSTATASNQLRDFGTLRARLGFTPVAPLLIYATGGLAYGRVSSNVQVGEAIVPTGNCIALFGTCNGTPAIGGSSSTRTGWTVGGGAEYLFAGQWSLKAEYLYYDLGSTSYGLTPITNLGLPGSPFITAAVTSSSSDFRGSVVRVGLNYKFGYSPVVTK